MPIVEIEIILKPSESIQGEMVSQLADKLGEIFDSPKGGTWVKTRGLNKDQYAENGGREADIFPVFVSVMKSKLPSTGEMQIEMEKITTVVAQICRRPSGNVHVMYEAEGRGRVAFGGKIIF